MPMADGVTQVQAARWIGDIRAATWLAIGLNMLLRLALLGLLVAVVTAPPDDPRFAGKGIGLRTVLVVLPLSVGIGAYWLWRRQAHGARDAYPVWVDNLFLSSLVLDVAGNVFAWYNAYPWFSVIPHFHGAGASAVTLTSVFRVSVAAALAAANIGHILLEGQEYYADVFFGTDNVRGEADSVNDLLAGVAGTVLYVAVYLLLIRGRRRMGT
jgi:hypothetical protein